MFIGKTLPHGRRSSLTPDFCPCKAHPPAKRIGKLYVLYFRYHFEVVGSSPLFSSLRWLFFAAHLLYIGHGKNIYGIILHIVQYGIILYNMVSYCTIWYHIVQYGIILYNMVSCTIWHHIVQYGIILYNMVSCTIWYHIVQYGIILYNMVSCTIWYNIVQYFSKMAISRHPGGLRRS